VYGFGWRGPGGLVYDFLQMERLCFIEIILKVRFCKSFGRPIHPFFGELCGKSRG